MEFKKLIRSEDRAVSPVIGVILMVAITVILAAVIGAFVLSMGDSVQQEAQGAVTWSVDHSDGEEGVTVSVTSLAQADEIVIRGDHNLNESAATLDQVGDSLKLEYDTDLDDNGTLTAVARWTTDDGETVETTIGTKSYDYTG